MPVQPAALELLAALSNVLARWGRWYVFGAQAVMARRASAQTSMSRSGSFPTSLNASRARGLGEANRHDAIERRGSERLNRGQRPGST